MAGVAAGADFPEQMGYAGSADGGAAAEGPAATGPAATGPAVAGGQEVVAAAVVAVGLGERPRPAAERALRCCC